MVEYEMKSSVSKSGKTRYYYYKIYKNGKKIKITSAEYKKKNPTKKLLKGGDPTLYDSLKNDINAHYTSNPEDVHVDILYNWFNENELDIQRLLANIDPNGISREPLSATVFNDYYKWSMLPVIRHMEQSKKFANNNIFVTFGVNIRNEEYRDLLFNDSNVQEKVLHTLQTLTERKFDKNLFRKIVSDKNLLIDDNTIDLVCGHDGEERSLIDYVIGEKYVPEEHEPNKVVVSFFPEYDSKIGGDRIYIEASGPWHKVTWLETTLMQSVYETLLRHKLEMEGKTYSQWVLEALIRCCKSVETVKDLNINGFNGTSRGSPFNGALFTGRRTGGYAFLLLQNLFVNDRYPSCIGSSSVDAWNKISEVRSEWQRKERKVLIPVGTHAHELSMVTSALLPEADIDTIPLTQIIGHYLYYLYSPVVPIPMLPDTLGTEAFMKIAQTINIPDKKTGELIPFMSIIGSARQDSGKLEKFVEIMDKYNFRKPIMASEIDDPKSLIDAYNTKHDDGEGAYAYSLFGAGGFFGDSEAAWNKSIKNISMATKAVRVFIDNTELDIKPIKTGNSNSGNKLEVNGLLRNNKPQIAKNRALRIKSANYNVESLPVSPQVIFDQKISDISIPSMNKKILLMGLSANPPTGDGGHRGICRYFVDTNMFSEIWLLPTYIHSYAEKGNALEYHHRVNLCKLNFEDLSTPTTTVIVQEIEKTFALEAGKKRYTADILENLRKFYPDVEFNWFMGWDTYIDLLNGKWGRPEYIIATTPLHVTYRIGSELVEENTKLYQSMMVNTLVYNGVPVKPNKITKHTIPLEEVSSTVIRKKFASTKNNNNNNLKRRNLYTNSPNFTLNEIYPPVLDYIVNTKDVLEYYQGKRNPLPAPVGSYNKYISNAKLDESIIPRNAYNQFVRNY